MTTPHIADTFLNLLEKSRLLSPQQIAETAERHRLFEEESAAAVAETFVAEGAITRFQADRLLAGRYRGFFIGRYKLLEVLGAGGMGRLYVAEEPETGQRVALKLLSELYKDDPGMQARLEMEARAGVKLNHPHIVRTQKLTRTDDVFQTRYLVMDYVEGISLHELLALHGRPPWSQACDFILQAAAGLQHAHEAGLVHRDIKPCNLLVDRAGWVRILDFGLALLEGEDESEFSLTMIFGQDCLGTADYMAPEQALDSGSVDARADIYSLGCTFYSTLTGRFPFQERSTSRTLQAHRAKEPRPVRQLAPDVPAGVVAVVEKMMAKRPEQRFQAADEVCRALEPFAQRQPASFDFQAILAARAKEAQRRLASQRKRRTRTRTSASTATTGVQTDLPNDSPQSDAEMQHETFDADEVQPEVARPEPSSASPVDSFPSPREQNELPLPPSAASRSVESRTTASAFLVPLDGGTVVPLDKEGLLIGRHPDCDVQLTSGQVSGRHCELRFDGNWWRVTDLDSKNGIRVNGAFAKDQLLWPGDRLTIAERFHFRLDLPTDGVGHGRFRRFVVWGLFAAGITTGLATTLWWLMG